MRRYLENETESAKLLRFNHLANMFYVSADLIQFIHDFKMKEEVTLDQ